MFNHSPLVTAPHFISSHLQLPHRPFPRSIAATATAMAAAASCSHPPFSPAASLHHRPHGARRCGFSPLPWPPPPPPRSSSRRWPRATTTTACTTRARTRRCGAATGSPSAWPSRAATPSSPAACSSPPATAASGSPTARRSRSSAPRSTRFRCSPSTPPPSTRWVTFLAAAVASH